MDGAVKSFVGTSMCLRVHINRNLSWNFHVLQAVCKINSAPRCLKVRKNIFSIELRKLIVTITVLEPIYYCSVVLVGATIENNLKLQRALNNSIRFIYNLRRNKDNTLLQGTRLAIDKESQNLFYVCFMNYW